MDALLHNTFTYDLTGNRVQAQIRQTGGTHSSSKLLTSAE